MNHLKRTRRRGSLLLTVFFLVVLYLLAAAYIVVLPQQMRSAYHEQTDVAGYYVANAGITDALNAIGSGQNPNLITPADLGNGWTYQVRVSQWPQPETGTFSLTSSALLDNVVRRKALVILQAHPSTIARYASFFLVSDPRIGASNGLWNEAAWPVGRPIDGDVYINGPWQLNMSGFNYGAGSTKAPIKGTVYATVKDASSPDGGIYSSPAPYLNATTPSIPKYKDIYTKAGASGTAAVKAGAATPNYLDPAYKLSPAAARDNFRKLAWGSALSATAAPLTTQGDLAINVDVQGKPTGGVWVKADSSQAVLGVTPGGNSQVTIKDGNGLTLYTVFEIKTAETVGGIPAATNTTVLIPADPSQTPKQFPGLTNGVYYFDCGGSDSAKVQVSGINAGAKSVVAGDGSLVVAGEVLRRDTVRGAIPATKSDVLGLAGIRMQSGGQSTTSMEVQLNGAIPTTDGIYHIYANLLCIGNNIFQNTSAQPSSVALHGAMAQITMDNVPTGGQTVDRPNFFANFVTPDGIQKDPFAGLLPPPGWMTLAGTFIKPTVEAYVEIPVGY